MDWFTKYFIFTAMGMYAMVFFLCTVASKKTTLAPRFGIAIVCLLFMICVGLRNELLGADTAMYLYIFERRVDEGTLFDAEWLFYDPIVLFAKVVGSTNLLLVPAMMFSWGLWRASKIWAQTTWPLLLLFFISGFTFYSCAINIMRSGVAMVFTLSAAYYALNTTGWSARRVLLFGLWAYAACAVHTFQFAFISLLFVVRLFPRIKFWLGIYAIISLLVIMGVNPIEWITSRFDIAVLLNDRAEGYAFATTEYRTGFRLDFFAFVTAMLAYPWFYIVIRGYNSLFYRRLVCFYLASSTTFVASFYMSFSDRVGMMAFWLIPLLAVVPLADPQYRFAKEDTRKGLVVAGLYGAMTFIYYYMLLMR